MALQEHRPGDPGMPGLFQATRWSLVLRAKEDSQTALGSLCESYRQPLLRWTRAKGFSNEDAEDIVQSFLAAMLRRNFLEKVGPEKGRFRSFLSGCLKNFVRDVITERKAGKRGGGLAPHSLDETNEVGQKVFEPAAASSSPDLEFDRAWANSVLVNALRRLRDECGRQAHAALYAELEPVMLADETALPYREIGARLGMSEGAVKVAALRLRARLGALIRDEVRQTVTNEQDLEEEVRYLIQLFARPA